MRQAILIVLLLWSFGCVATPRPAVEPPRQCVQYPLSDSPQWYDSGKTYRLRHDGVLRMGKTTIPLTGFMILDTRNHTAKVAMLTGLGLKLATLRVTATSHEILTTTPAAQRIPHFIEQCVATIQRAFLADFPDKNSPCATHSGKQILTDAHEHGTVRSILDGATGSLVEKRLISSNGWRVEYGKLIAFGDISLPETVSLHNDTPDYSVTLQLNNAQ